MPADEQIVSANVILRSWTGKSVLAARSEISPQNVKELLPKKETIEEANRRLKALTFQIALVTETYISIRGSKELYERVFQIQLTAKFAPYVESLQNRYQQPYFVPDKPPKIPAELADVIEAIEFPGPVTYHASPTPPTLPYYHLKVPDDVARAMDASRVHLLGITGTGIRLAMVDSGFVKPLHPYYANKGYNIKPLVPDINDTNPDDDPNGHGTGMAACALAVAPGVAFTLFKEYAGNAHGAFSRAVMQRPHIITNSWETNYDAAATLHLEITNAVANGIVVLFACGNGPNVGWPGSEQSVISVGGAFIDKDGSIRASDYASSGINPSVPGRQCPDLCGLSGMMPRGILIALPTRPGSGKDIGFSAGGRLFPNGDQTASNDGWFVASGTSSAAPMVAGVAALVMQANPTTERKPAAVRDALIKSCIDVTNGNSASGEAARQGPDRATGAGLVQAYGAIRAAGFSDDSDTSRPGGNLERG